MAAVNILVANPTTADVTVNAKVAKARTVTQLSLDDTTTECEQFLAAKCALVSASAQSSLSARTEAAFLLEKLQHLQ
jgi:hypothetical protein